MYAFYSDDTIYIYIEPSRSRRINCSCKYFIRRSQLYSSECDDDCDDDNNNKRDQTFPENASGALLPHIPRRTAMRIYVYYTRRHYKL